MWQAASIAPGNQKVCGLCGSTISMNKQTNIPYHRLFNLYRRSAYEARNLWHDVQLFFFFFYLTSYRHFALWHIDIYHGTQPVQIITSLQKKKAVQSVYSSQSQWLSITFIINQMCLLICWYCYDLLKFISTALIWYSLRLRTYENLYKLSLLLTMLSVCQ
jgi:hypothetical protein